MVSDAPIRAVEAFIEAQMSLGQTPGLAISVWRDGQSLLQRGYGTADVDTGTPMTERTGVVIGSTTKALTCVALLQLVRRGFLDLDVPVQRYLPGFRLADPAQAARITLRQAITHTAGLPATRSDRGEFLFNDDVADDALARGVDALADRVPIGPPGAGWVYANDGYALAGRAIEVVTGESYEAYMREHVFDPLGFTDTFFSHEVPAGAEIAVAHDFDASGAPYASFFPHNRAGAAAGSQLVMSARDAARWLEAVLHGGAGESGALLAPDGFAELLRPVATLPTGIRASDGESSRYALGWMVGPVHGIPAISHGGSAITMGSHFLLVPEQRLAIAVLANSSSEVNAIVAEGIASILLGRVPERSFPAVDSDYVPDRSRWPLLTGVYVPQRAQNSVPAPLPMEFDGIGLLAHTYPADGRRRAGDIFLRPTGDLSFVLSGRGRTGGRASFTIDAGAIEALWMDVPLRKMP